MKTRGGNVARAFRSTRDYLLTHLAVRIARAVPAGISADRPMTARSSVPVRASYTSRFTSRSFARRDSRVSPRIPHRFLFERARSPINRAGSFATNSSGFADYSRTMARVKRVLTNQGFASPVNLVLTPRCTTTRQTRGFDKQASLRAFQFKLRIALLLYSVARKVRADFSLTYKSIYSYLNFNPRVSILFSGTNSPDNFRLNR